MRTYTKPLRKVFDERTCSEIGCATRYIPTGPNQKYCPDHGDSVLRARGEWHVLRARSRRRLAFSDRCECCGDPAHGCSHRGVVCCDRCRTDAITAERDMLAERGHAS